MRAGLKYCARSMAVAIGLAMTSGMVMAQSSVSLYGLVDAWVGIQKSPGEQRAWSEQGGGMSTSYWGIGGTEDLGGGVKSLFVLEGFFRPQNGAYGRYTGDAFFGRNAYVGLETHYGTFTAGRLTTPYYVSTLLFNPFGDSFTFSPWVTQVYLGLAGQGVTGDSDWNNAVMYSSPDFGGLTTNAIYAFGNTPSLGQHQWGVQALYFHGPLSATVAYQAVRYNALAGDLGTVLPGMTSQGAFQAGAAYDLEFAKFFVTYQNVENNVVTGNYEVNSGQVGVSAPIGPGKAMVSYARSKSSSNANGGGIRRTTWALGYDYPLSKRTNVYAAYMNDKVSGESTGDTAGVGIRMKF